MIYTAHRCITDYGQHDTCPPSTIPQSLSLPHSTHTTHTRDDQSSRPWTRSPVSPSPAPAAGVDSAWEQKKLEEGFVSQCFRMISCLYLYL